MNEDETMSYSDKQLKKIDAGDRQKKYHQRFQVEDSKTLVGAVNTVGDSLCLILIELRRMNNFLDYLSPPNEQKNRKGR